MVKNYQWSHLHIENDVTSLFKLAIELAENEILEITEDNWQNEMTLSLSFFMQLGQDLGSPWCI